MTEIGYYFIAGFSLGSVIAFIIAKFFLQRQQQQMAALATELRSHSFELQITLNELADKNQLLQQQSFIDSLTSAYNRSYFDQQMAAEITRSRREQTPLALILIDIDHFKSINDNNGHLIGDQVVIKLVSLMKAQLKRGCDKVCRYGGDEFAIILPNTELTGAISLAESILQQLNQAPLIAHEHILNISISAGCYAAIATKDSNITEYVSQADKALYLSKSKGRNQVYPQSSSTAQLST
ncbi:GGDEF domain-containing protein [Rheinheimera sp. WS51]|uniref:GGDEF domain-containing protein n=1 Tax=Rheinheimera sp. WS51 TaxID=3425886 RepID=UPI003D9218E0